MTIYSSLTFSNPPKYSVPDSLFYKDCLTFTKKSLTGLYFIIANEVRQYNDLTKYNVSDFVLKVGGDAAVIYFVANNTTYSYNGNTTVVSVLDAKSLVLSIDKYNNAYFGDATISVIYKMDTDINQLVEYAAYESGSMDKFVFDKNDNIISYDSSDGSFSLWKPDLIPNTE